VAFIWFAENAIPTGKSEEVLQRFADLLPLVGFFIAGGIALFTKMKIMQNYFFTSLLLQIYILLAESTICSSIFLNINDKYLEDRMFIYNKLKMLPN
jgi:hypothetical protein